MERKPELDFLRGIAIILVLIRHSDISINLVYMGWIGVDLFFVLSGFLVSGLIFREYQKTETFNLKRFFIRRGFKIYPLFYVTTIPYTLLKIYNGDWNTLHFLGDLLFLQNYVSEWGYLNPAGWSLAVEEHFYILLSLLALITLKRKKRNKNLSKSFGLWIILFMILPLVARILAFFYWSEGANHEKITSSHFRIDSLMSGVLVSYLFTFKFDALKEFVRLYLNWLWLVIVLGLLWTPFINIFQSDFVKVFGFTLVYISFASLLLVFLFVDQIYNKIKAVFSPMIGSTFVKIGVSSYAIYLIHTLVNIAWERIVPETNIFGASYLIFAITSLISILAGILLTRIIEKPFLQYRDRKYPRLSN